MGAVFSTITPIKRIEFSENIAGKDPISSEGALPFQSFLNDSLKQFASAEEVAAQDSINLALGNVDDLAQIQINSLKAQAALQTTVQITSRAINAYKEIMQMQI